MGKTTVKGEGLLKFPDGFLWGASTSAHQIEGNNRNDWSEWEGSEFRISNLKFRNKEKLDPENFVSGRACDSYNRWEEDLKLIGELNCNAYRFSIEWSRIEPEEGKWDMAEVEHYRAILRKMREKNIKSFVTLWHWTNPVWLAADGGWADRRVVRRFARFTGFVVKELGEYVDSWVTLNEPLMHVAHGYITGKFPPNHSRDFMGGIKASSNLVAAHKEAYKEIHAGLPDAKVSIAMSSGYFSTAHKYCLTEKMIAGAAHYLRNEWFLERIAGHYDCLGVNYYHHDRIVWYPPFKENLNEKVSDFGWEIFPEGIYHVLKNYQKYGKPIYVLENGVADRDDKLRKDFIISHLEYVHKAISEGADVRGYFHWSLLDNFEWADGYDMKFGLYRVDRKTFERIKRPSAEVYADICKNNGFKS